MYVIKVRYQHEDSMTEVYEGQAIRYAEWMFIGAVYDLGVEIVEMYHYDKLIRYISKVLEERKEHCQANDTDQTSTLSQGN